MKSEELLSILIQLSKADNYFDEFELTYLLKVGRHIGLSDDSVEIMIKENKVLPLTVPKDEQERMTIIYYMLFLMKVDDDVNKEERELLHHYGFKLGFSAEMIEDFIQVIINNKGANLETEALLKVIRKYQN